MHAAKEYRNEDSTTFPRPTRGALGINCECGVHLLIDLATKANVKCVCGREFRWNGVSATGTESRQLQ